MTEQSTRIKLETASITDRGLNQRRPLNEDSLLSDGERRVFAVADGVGGAEAGEVASQTAVEVLNEAFRHHKPGDDIEDLMELAIQRANTSIHQMAREHPKLAMMATTIVALHLDGRRATIGHVGDSRLYRLSPDGHLHRETADHSVVEEEVRAGRMTPEQAANHPSRNVISRALGAEATVEVDMKTIEVEDGTTFLLCSDGIVRHIPDGELRELLVGTNDLEAVCAEMKRRCFARGAEDNLTAVLVRVGQGARRTAGNAAGDEDDERTLLVERSALATADTRSEDEHVLPTLLQRPFDDAGAAYSPPGSPPALAAEGPFRAGTDRVADQAGRSPARGAARAFWRAFGITLLIVGASALAFYGGMRYQRQMSPPAVTSSAIAPPVAPLTTPDSVEGNYLKLRRQVDRAPAAEADRMASEMNGQPLSSSDPEFLYLYGRARLLSGNPQEAVRAFETAIARIDDNMTPERGQLKIEARVATVAAALRSNDLASAQDAAKALDDVISGGTGAAAGTESPQVTAPSP